MSKIHVKNILFYFDFILFELYDITVRIRKQREDC